MRQKKPSQRVHSKETRQDKTSVTDLRSHTAPFSIPPLQGVKIMYEDIYLIYRSLGAFPILANDQKVSDGATLGHGCGCVRLPHPTQRPSTSKLTLPFVKES